jgi:perosamine synthetase
MEEKLAILGGKPVFNNKLPITNNIGDEEKKAVMRVMDRGILSGFVARWDERFYGSIEVKNFEKNFGDKFGVKHAVSFNSATTALHGAIAAAGIGPGDEVITSPYTMSATPSSVLMNQAVPIFADIDEKTFCLDPDDVEKKITSRTKAILTVNLFGHPSDFDKLLSIAEKHNLILIEDNAQSPGAIYNNKITGSIGHMGVFSYNFHKTMQCGEGGVLITNNDNYAFRAQLLRNHGEVVVDEMDDNDARKQSTILLGNNYRLSELHAAISNEQLKKLEFLTEERIKLANYLTEKLKKIPGLIPAYVQDGCKHVYYVYPIKFDSKVWGVPRSVFAKALKAEGAPITEGYVKPLYLIPMYQRLNVYNKTSYPFNLCNRDASSYSKGICPVVERMYEKELLLTNICRYPLTKEHIDLFISAIEKIYANKSQLKDIKND